MLAAVHFAADAGHQEVIDNGPPSALDPAPNSDGEDEDVEVAYEMPWRSRQCATS